jgi:hypothetical protein
VATYGRRKHVIEPLERIGGVMLRCERVGRHDDGRARAPHDLSDDRPVGRDDRVDVRPAVQVDDGGGSAPALRHERVHRMAVVNGPFDGAVPSQRRRDRGIHPLPLADQRRRFSRREPARLSGEHVARHTHEQAHRVASASGASISRMAACRVPTA